MFIILIFDFFFRLHSLLHSFTMFWRFQRVYSYMSQLWSCCWIEGKASRYVLSFTHIRSFKIIFCSLLLQQKMNCHYSLFYLPTYCAECFVHPIFRFLVTVGDEVTKIPKYNIVYVYLFYDNMGKREKTERKSCN